MTSKSWIFTAIASLMLTVPSTVGAQSIEFGPDGLRLNPPGLDRRDETPRIRGDDFIVRDEIGPREAASIARDAGLAEVDEVVRNRNSYRVVGVDDRGRDMQITVDRASGEVIGRRRI